MFSKKKSRSFLTNFYVLVAGVPFNFLPFCDGFQPLFEGFMCSVFSCILLA